MRHPICGLISIALLFVAAGSFGQDQPAEKPADALAPVNSDAGMDKTVPQLAVIVKKSVVVVTFRGRDGERQGLGSGFIIDPNGLIATNLHVIGEARPISVELQDGRKFDVTAIEATERSHALAVLRIDAKDLPALPPGNSDDPLEKCVPGVSPVKQTEKFATRLNLHTGLTPFSIHFGCGGTK